VNFVALTHITLQIPIQRYNENKGSHVRTAHEVPLDGEEIINDAELDGELAELSLGEKLAANTTIPHLPATDKKVEDPEDHTIPPHVDPISLTRTLIQALHLHSNNAQLLESVLRSRGETLILNTEETASHVRGTACERMCRSFESRAGRRPGRYQDCKWFRCGCECGEKYSEMVTRHTHCTYVAPPECTSRFFRSSPHRIQVPY